MMNLFFAKSVRAVNSMLLTVAVTGFLAPVAIDKALNSTGFDSLLVSEALAQATPREKRKLPGLSETFYKKLTKVTALAAPEADKNGVTPPADFRGALAELKKIEKGCTKCNQYELAQVYNYYGWIYYSLEETENAIEYYDKVIAQSPNISWGLELQVRFTLAQLQFSLENYPDALKRLNEWMSLSETIGDDVYYLKSSICYQMDDKVCALKAINTAVKMVEGKGKIAKEAWYSLQRALHLEKEDYRAAEPVLLKMVRHYPKHSYHHQLASVYGILEQIDKQLAVLEASYISGGLNREQQLLNLAYLMLQNDYPYRAGIILAKGMKDKIVERTEKNLETLAKSWSLSQEKRKAIPVMAEAAKLSDDGDLYGVLMGLYLDVDDSENAIKAGKDALKKGDLDREGDINLNIGVAYMELDKFSDAITYFKKAKKDKRTKRFAESWLAHAEREEYRQKQLEKET